MRCAGAADLYFATAEQAPEPAPPFGGMGMPSFGQNFSHLGTTTFRGTSPHVQQQQQPPSMFGGGMLPAFNVPRGSWCGPHSSMLHGTLALLP